MPKHPPPTTSTGSSFPQTIIDGYCTESAQRHFESHADRAFLNISQVNVKK
jgi:hypothetical protein